jgi:hypothetical protein
MCALFGLRWHFIISFELQEPFWHLEFPELWLIRQHPKRIFFCDFFIELLEFGIETNPFLLLLLICGKIPSPSPLNLDSCFSDSDVRFPDANGTK